MAWIATGLAGSCLPAQFLCAVHGGSMSCKSMKSTLPTTCYKVGDAASVVLNSRSFQERTALQQQSNLYADNCTVYR